MTDAYNGKRSNRWRRWAANTKRSQRGHMVGRAFYLSRFTIRIQIHHPGVAGGGWRGGIGVANTTTLWHAYKV